MMPAERLKPLGNLGLLAPTQMMIRGAPGTIMGSGNRSIGSYPPDHTDDEEIVTPVVGVDDR